MHNDRNTNASLMVISVLVLIVPAIFLLGSAGAASKIRLSRPWMDKSFSPEKRADLLLEQMTLDEKVAMLHGVRPVPVKGYTGYVPPNTRLGIPALTLADGRAGVGNEARDVTLLPAPIAAAASWDTDLMNTYGKVLGEEQWNKGTNVVLGPSINVVRVPEWGRAFESYSEDPYFNGQMAVAEIRGIQSRGPIADANMYLTMNQESDRLTEDSIVDERTLHEIYLPPFAAAIEKAHVGTVMCAYVKTNGIYSCDSANLLTKILRDELHFDGWVMTDWRAAHSTINAAISGLDQEMPDDKFFGEPLKAAVVSAKLSMDVLNERVRDILVPMFRQGLFDRKITGHWGANVRSPGHDSWSRMMSEQGTVLLKNNGNILPLLKTASIAVIGAAGGTTPKAQGLGSSQVIAPYVVSPVEGIRKRAGEGIRVVYADGSDLRLAAKTAQSADIAIVFVQTDDSEGIDRPNLLLPGNQNQLIDAVAGANSRTIVVLDTGGAVLMPWLDKVAAIVEAWYPGQEDGNAIAAVLYGDINPSAKLPLTFPRAKEEIPTSRQEQWPGVNGRSEYSEKLNVGYRWYDATQTQPLFPFGFGLSYTTFRLSHLVVTPSKIQAGPSSYGVGIKVLVTNTGKREGAEVVQVYVGQPRSNGEPPHQLGAFGKVMLKPGETKSLSITLDSRSFSTYDTSLHRWIYPGGTYEISVGTSSRDLPLSDHITINAPPESVQQP